VAEWLGRFKTPVVVTKHWKEIPSNILSRFSKIGAIFNTSISALDMEDEREHRLDQFYRIRQSGVKSWLRIVTAKYGITDEGRYLSTIQKWLLINEPIIDNPLRIPMNDRRVLDGTIIASMITDMAGKSSISRMNDNSYLGYCSRCPDQCGAIQERGLQ
jgi:hypothetical protein